MTYTIIRFYADNRKNRIVKEHVSELEAKLHCQSEETRGKSWFDGYTSEAKAVDKKVFNLN